MSSIPCHAPSLAAAMAEMSRVLRLLLTPGEYEYCQSTFNKLNIPQIVEHGSLSAEHQGITTTDWSHQHYSAHLLSFCDPLPTTTFIPYLLRPWQRLATASVTVTNSSVLQGLSVQLFSAAALLWAVAELKSCPELIEGGLHPVQKKLLAQVFCACREPSDTTDQIKVYPESIHAAVLYKGAAFSVDILSKGPDNSTALPVSKIYSQLQGVIISAAASTTPGIATQDNPCTAIQDGTRTLQTKPNEFPIQQAGLIETKHDLSCMTTIPCNAVPSSLSVCELSSLQRGVWQAVRAQLLSSGSSEQLTSLAALESAVVALSLEDGSRKSSPDDALNMVRQGAFGMRYYDKVLGLVVFKDAAAGLACELSAVRDDVIASLAEQLWSLAKTCTVEDVMSSHDILTPQGVISPIHPLNISVEETMLVELLGKYKGTPVSKCENLITTFQVDFNPRLLSTLCVSDLVYDAWVNFSLQVALEKTFGKTFTIVRQTNSKDLENGGNDLVCTLSKESLNLVREIVEPKADQHDLPYLMDLYSLALKQYKIQVEECKEGWSIMQHAAKLTKLVSEDDECRHFMDKFNNSLVYLSGQNVSQGLDCNVGGFYSPTQLIVSYVGHQDTIKFVLSSRGCQSKTLKLLHDHMDSALHILKYTVLKHELMKTEARTDLSYLSSSNSNIIWENKLYFAYLNPNPCAPGSTIVSMKNSPYNCSIFEIPLEDYTELLLAVREVAKLLCKKVPVARCALVAVPKPGQCVHAQLIPLHGLSAEWSSICAGEQEFHVEFPGFCTSKNGPRLTDEELNMIQLQIRGQRKYEVDYNFLGDPDDQNLFARITRGDEKEQWRVWEDNTHIAFLTPFPNTPGFTVLIPRSHLPSDLFKLIKADYLKLIESAYKVYITLQKGLSTNSCAMIFEGYEIDYAHAKIIPLKKTSKMPTSVGLTNYCTAYDGYVTSADGPPATKEQLLEMQAIIIC